MKISKTVTLHWLSAGKWGKGNDESCLRRRKSWNGNRQWQVGRGRGQNIEWETVDDRWLELTSQHHQLQHCQPVSSCTGASLGRDFSEKFKLPTLKSPNNNKEYLWATISCLYLIIYTHRFYFWHRTGQGLPLENRLDNCCNKRWCQLSSVEVWRRPC